MSHYIEFGPFTYDTARAQLTRDGVATSVGGRAGALLAALLDAGGNVVSKDELLEAAWPGLAVEESNLAVQIAALRRALGEQQSGHDWIVTVPRLGYRMPLPTAVLPDVQGRFRRPSLAVLPFKNIGSDTEQEYFADGVVEEIITALSRFQSFAVVSRNSTFAYKGRSVDVRKVGSELGVRYLLEGSVRAAGDRLRVTAQLVEAEHGLQIWADRFDGTRADIFEVQDRITDAVARAVQPNITRAEVERSRLRRTNSPSAYDLYLQALPEALYRQGRRVTDLLEQALRLDPEFVLAAAAAAEQYLASYHHQAPGASLADRERGVELMEWLLPRCGSDSTLLGKCGLMLMSIREYDRGLDLVQRAVTENPNDASALSAAGIVNLFGGDLGRAAEYQLRSLAMSPNEYTAHGQLTCVSHIRLAEGDHEEALRWAERSLAVSASYTPTYWMLIAGNAHLGRMEEARHWAAELLRINPVLTMSRLRLGQHARDMARVEVLFKGMHMAGLTET